jgi:ankyrin repeat protein
MRQRTINGVAGGSRSPKALIGLYAFCALCAASQSRVDHLLAASAAGDVAKIQTLLKQGVDVNARNERGQTAVLLAAAGGYSEAARLLLKQGADVNAGDKSGETTLMLAAKGGHLGILNELLNCGARINATNSLPMTAILYAVMSDQVLAVAEVLVKKGADVNAWTSSGTGALIVAASEGHTAAATFLLALGANPTNRTTMADAACGGHRS